MRVRTFGIGLLLLGSMLARADDLCRAGPKSEWLTKVELEQKLLAQGWKLRRIKVDDGCYEVYGWNPGGEPVKALFHPRTFQPVAGHH